MKSQDDEYIQAKKQQAKSDMLFGSLWCIGGIIATAADIGFIFWGCNRVWRNTIH